MMKYHYIPSRMAKIKIMSTPNVEEDMKILGHQYIVEENIKLYNHSGKHFGNFLKQIKK